MVSKWMLGLAALGFMVAGMSAVIGTSTVRAAAAPVAAPATAAATQKAEDVKNTKCVVMSDDDAGDTTVDYKGKTYHLCCTSCLKAFNKDPEKYVKAFDADPASFGVPAAKK